MYKILKHNYIETHGVVDIKFNTSILVSCTNSKTEFLIKII